MTAYSSGNTSTRDSFIRALARYERRGDAGLQAGNGGVEHVARERVIVLAAGEAMADGDDGRANQRRPQHVHGDVRAERRRQLAGINGALDGGDGVGQHLLQQLEAFPLLRDARDRKSTRLNSSHLVISYAVFCLK